MVRRDPELLREPPLRIRRVTRLLVIVLLVLLPIQLVWAAAAPYCAHEPTTAASKHFGHHEHKHQASESAPNTDALGTYHADCETCHLGASASLAPPMLDMFVLPDATSRSDHIPRFRSYFPPGLERPDRSAAP